MSGPTTWTWAGQRRGYSSWGKVATSASSAADAAVNMCERGQAELGARAVELYSPSLEAALDGPGGAPPQGAPGGGPGQASAERVDREAGSAVRIDVGDERGAAHALELGGERGCEREDVGDHGVRSQLAHERLRVARGLNDGLVEVERLGPGWEHLVLGGGRERETLAPRRARASASTSAA